MQTRFEETGLRTISVLPDNNDRPSLVRRKERSVFSSIVVKVLALQLCLSVLDSHFLPVHLLALPKALFLGQNSGRLLLKQRRSGTTSIFHVPPSRKRLAQEATETKSAKIEDYIQQ